MPLSAPVGSWGSIPACAGEPHRGSPGAGVYRVYPRVCGGTAVRHRRQRKKAGLSPRVRGNRRLQPRLHIPGRSIPACAGEPLQGTVSPPAPGVYPRVCGGTREVRTSSSVAPGLSPRVRGNQELWAAVVKPHRSIPACAGEPARTPAPPGYRGVYPRVCGGTLRCRLVRRRLQGLSPRVRGNPSVAPPLTEVDGLSPRVRGNHQFPHLPHQQGRSIPACAGEPTASPGRWVPLSVYPRVCGGTCTTLAGCITRVGLSPRVRGNLRNPPGRFQPDRSIPACAGEPLGLLITPPAILFAVGIMETRWR